MEKKKKPAIRFKGFTDSWEQRKLEDMCTIITKQTGFDYSATIKPSLVTTKGNDTYSFIQNKDFEGTNINLDTDFYIPISVAEKYPKITLDQPSLLISISGRIGNVGLYLLNSKAFIGGAVGICKLKNTEDGKTALYELLAPGGQKYFNSLIKASSHANITVEDIRNIEVILPKDEVEKKKLNSYFCNLDHLITLHQRKYDKLQIIKKSMLEKMFPQSGSCFPEIRFKGFTDSWEQRKLSSLCEKFTDGDWIESEDQSDSGVRLIQTGNVGVTEYLDKPNNKKWISDETFDRLHCEEVLPGDILISRLPEPAGRACIMPSLGTKMITAVDCTIVRTSPDVSNKFLVQYLSSQPYFNEVNTCLAGGTRQRISRSNLSNFMVPIPSEKDEQDAIGAVFENLDRLITLHQREVEKLQNIKKSMLETMFV